jgi:DNA-binding transcriptional MerR regulator
MPNREYVNAADAAARLGVSAKALRLYERRGLLTPVRTAAGWRTYGPDQLRRAAEIAVLRGIGFSLGQVARVIQGEPDGLEPALAAHQLVLDDRLRQLAGMIDRLRQLREGLAAGDVPTASQLAQLLAPAAMPAVPLALPWPWGGERFDLAIARPLTHITGPLGSGKTRLAKLIAATLPGASFLGPDRRSDSDVDATDPAVRSRIDAAMGWLADEGAASSDALRDLISALEADTTGVLVVDMVEDGLDQPTQEALMAFLRRRGPGARPLFLLTRSNAILDLASVGPGEAIIFCPANHSPPRYVAPHPGAPGYEALASCLASPAVRARTTGVIAWRPEVV